MSANFVAREVGYQMTGGWMHGESATQDYFKPLETYGERFDALLGEVAGLGFGAIDLWGAHLHPDWASPRHIEVANSLLKKHRLEVVSLAIRLPDDLSQIEKILALAQSIGARIIGGGRAPAVLAEMRPNVVRLLEKYDVVYGFENHPQKTPDEVLAVIGTGECGRIGVSLDTGWFATQGCDALEALRALAPRLTMLHLKDIHSPLKRSGPTMKDMGHETCALGDGIVPVEACVRFLKAAHIMIPISIEHEPEDHDPGTDLALSLERLKNWLNS